MFNVAVFRLKDMLKYLVVITISITMVIMTTRFFNSKSEKNIEIGVDKQIRKIMSNTYLQVMDTQIPLIKEIQSNSNDKEIKNKLGNKKDNYLEAFLKTEISSFETMEKNNNENQQQNLEKDIAKEEINENEIVESINEEVKTGQSTQIVTNNPIQENFNTQYANVKIKNGTNITLTEEMLKPDITIDNKNILIFHTHSCESYTSSEQYPYVPTGTFRTTDLNYTVVRVGTELETQLKRYNIPVIHNSAYHDYPAYSGSYTRSLATVQNVLATTPSDIVIDLHRDAIGARADYAPTVKIGEEYAAQIMYVIGTNEGGLQHPNWQQNLKFAIKVQEKAEEMYPGLFKPMLVTPNRYNQHVSKYANIIEVGATGNTLEQCLNSMKYLGKVLDEVLNN